MERRVPGAGGMWSGELVSSVDRASVWGGENILGTGRSDSHTVM